MRNTTTNPITRAQQLRFPGFLAAFEQARELPLKKLIARLDAEDSPELNLAIDVAIDEAKERRAARFEG